MCKLILLVFLCLLAIAPAFGQENKNLVLGRPYTYWPRPSYGGCRDDGDRTQLTDGVTKYGGNMWMNPSCVGWAEGVVEVGLRVFVSPDDAHYVLAGEHPAPPPTHGKDIRVGIQVKVPLNGTLARYVAVVAMAPAPHYFVFVDEIEVIGRIPADARSTVPVASAPPLAGGTQGGRSSTPSRRPHSASPTSRTRKRP